MKTTAPTATVLIIGGLALGLWQAGGVAGNEKAGKQEIAMLEGTWKLVKAESEGKPEPLEDAPYTTITIKGHTITFFKGKDPVRTIGFRIDPSKKPKWIDLKSPDPKLGPDMPGIYQLEKDQLTICSVRGYRNDKPERPTDFSTKSDKFRQLIIFKRVIP